MGKKKGQRRGPKTWVCTPSSFDLHDGSTFWVTDNLCVQTVAFDEHGSRRYRLECLHGHAHTPHVRDLLKEAAISAAFDAALLQWDLPQSFGKASPRVTTPSNPPTYSHVFEPPDVDPPEWQERIDPETQSIYYYNPTTKESRWQAPTAMDALEHAVDHRTVTTGLFAHGLPSAPLPGQHIVFDPPSSEDSQSSMPVEQDETLPEAATEAVYQPAPEPTSCQQPLESSAPTAAPKDPLSGVPVWPADDPTLASFWNARHELFSRFDDGILIDREGWFSVTPECIAAHQAGVLLPKTPGLVVDLGCCVGGNTVQLAAAGHHVLAVDMCLPRLALAANNARVYGVRDRVTFVAADMRHMQGWRVEVRVLHDCMYIFCNALRAGRCGVCVTAVGWVWVQGKAGVWCAQGHWRYGSVAVRGLGHCAWPAQGALLAVACASHCVRAGPSAWAGGCVFAAQHQPDRGGDVGAAWVLVAGGALHRGAQVQGGDAGGV